MATADGLWAILSAPDKQFSGWSIDEFLQTGEEEVAALMREANRLSLPKRRGTAIDFGCGAGRMTRALSRYFAKCFGVDISEPMLERARQLAPNCEFRRSENLSAFPDESADLIFSTLVLQHQPGREQIKLLIADMVRVLAADGLLVFQIPTYIPLRYRFQLRRRLYRMGRALGVPHSFLYARMRLDPIRMFSMSPERIKDAVTAAGGKVLSVDVFKRDRDVYTDGVYYCTVQKSAST